MPSASTDRVARGRAAAIRPRWTNAVALIACGLLALLDGADAQSLAIAAPLIAKTLLLPSAAIGVIFSVAALGSALGYIGGGVLADRRGARSIVVAGAGIVGAFQLLTPHVHDAVALAVVRFTVSLGLGGIVPGLLMLVASVAPARWRTRFQGLLWACFPLGVLSGGIVNGMILSRGQWQTIFVVGGLAPLVVALVLLAAAPGTQRQPPRETAGRSGARRRLAGVSWRRLTLTGSVFFFVNGAISIVLNWTPSLLVTAGFPPAIGGQALAWNAGGALISMTATGFVVERSVLVPIRLGLAVATFASAALALLLHALVPVAVLLVILGAALGLAGTSAVFLAARLFPDGNAASGIGICMAIGRLGQMIFPGLIGLGLTAGMSATEVLLLTAVLPLLGGLAALGISLPSVVPLPDSAAPAGN